MRNVADNSQSPERPPDPSGDSGLSAAVRALEKLVDLTTLEVDLMKATNSLLVTGGKTATKGTQSGPRGASGGPAAPSEGPKGLGHVLGDMFGDRVRGSRYGRYGSAARKVASGAATDLGASSGAAGKLGAAAGGAGALIGAGIMLVEAAIKARNAINDWTNAAFESAARLAEVSGSMAAVMANRQVDQIQRDIIRGESTAGSTNRLQQAESRRKDEENRLGITIDNATNTVLTALNNLLTPVINKINAGVELMREMPPWLRAIAGPLGLIADVLEPGADAIGKGTLVEIGEAARAEMAAEDARGARLMRMAREAADAATVGRAPAGAAPLGAGPFGGRP